MHDASPHALARALEQQAPFLTRLAGALITDAHAVEDLVQDTLASALAQSSEREREQDPEARLEALPPGRLRAWLATVLRRRSIDYRRTRRLETLGADGSPDPAARTASPSEIAERLESQRMLHSALARLPDACSAVLVLRYQDGLSAAEIATATDTPLPTVKSRIHRGLELLRLELDRISGAGDDARERWLRSVAPLAVLRRPLSAKAAPGVLAGTAITRFLTTIMLKQTFIAVAVSALLVMTWFLVVPDRNPDGGRTDDVLQSAAPASVTGHGIAPVAADGTRRQATEGSGKLAGNDMDSAVLAGDALVFPVTILAQVVSSSSGAPVSARVQSGGSHVPTALSLDGAIAFQCMASDDLPLRLVHPRFELLELTRSALGQHTIVGGVVDVGVLEMTPVGEVTLTVLGDGGAPVVGARCVLQRRLKLELGGNGPGPSELDRSRFVGETDGNGQVTFPLAYEATVLVSRPDGRLGAGLMVTGADSVIRIDGPARSIVMTYADNGEPVAGRAFPVGWQRDAAEIGWFLWTDDDGRSALPVGAGMLTVCKSEPRLMLDAVFFRERSVNGDFEDSFKMRVRIPADVTDISLTVSRDEVALRLVDATTGGSIDGTAYWSVQRLGSDGQWSGLYGKIPYPVVDGRLVAHSWFTDPAEDRRRWIAVAGYAIKFLDGALPLAGATVALEPAAARSLRIVDSAGRPNPIRGSITFACGVEIAFDTDAAGLAGPFPWTEGEVWRLCGLDSVAPGGGTPVEISSDELAAAEIVLVHAPASSGAIRVTGVPTDASPILASAGRTLRSVTRLESTEQAGAAGLARLDAVIDGLAPGTYVVGPQEWVAQMTNHLMLNVGMSGPPKEMISSGKDLQVHVTSDSVVEIPWDPRWQAEQPTRGRVVCQGLDGDELAIMPIYGAVGTKIYLGSHSPWRYCDSEGRFQTAAGDPEPIAFLFARFEHDWSGRHPVILDSKLVRADGVYHIALTSFELKATNAEEWADAAQGPRWYPRVALPGDPSGLDAPMEFFHGVMSRRWNPAEPLRMTRLPTHISRLRVTYRGRDGRQTVLIPLTGDGRVEVSVPVPEATRETQRDDKRPRVR